MHDLLLEGAEEPLDDAVIRHDDSGACHLAEPQGDWLYGATIRDERHREHVKCGQAVGETVSRELELVTWPPLATGPDAP